MCRCWDGMENVRLFFDFSMKNHMSNVSVLIKKTTFLCHIFRRKVVIDTLLSIAIINRYDYRITLNFA